MISTSYYRGASGLSKLSEDLGLEAREGRTHMQHTAQGNSGFAGVQEAGTSLEGGGSRNEGASQANGNLHGMGAGGPFEYDSEQMAMLDQAPYGLNSEVPSNKWRAKLYQLNP